jgi:pimeloyl-ACP methyl ester carboxylesterase
MEKLSLSHLNGLRPIDKPLFSLVKGWKFPNFFHSQPVFSTVSCQVFHRKSPKTFSIVTLDTSGSIKENPFVIIIVSKIYQRHGSNKPMPIIDLLGVPHSYELTRPLANPSEPVLIYIHGWLLSRRYWQPLIQSLGEDYPCLSYDLRGFGDSPNQLRSSETTLDPLQSPYSLAAYAEDLKILLETLNIQKAWLIGHSLGGSIALWGANLCPERVQGVICLNAGGGIYLKEEFERFRQMGKQLVKFRSPWLRSIPLMDQLFARLMVNQSLDKQWGKQRLWDFTQADADAALGSLLESTTEEEVHLLPQIVAQLSQPVYFLAGSQDKIMETQYVRYLASFHALFNPQGKNVIEIPNCGHLAMLEQPEIVIDKIRQILQISGC